MARNDPITAGYEAAVNNAGRILLVWALQDLQDAHGVAGGAIRGQARIVSRRRSDQRRHAAAHREARHYVPRGPGRLEYMTALIKHLADGYTDLHRGQEATGLMASRRRVDLMLLGSASYAVYRDAPATGDRVRRARASYFERLRAGADMVARRGAGRCINGECAQLTTNSDYCTSCAVDSTVLLDDVKRRKAIEALWTSVLSPELAPPRHVRAREQRRAKSRQLSAARI